MPTIFKHIATEDTPERAANRKAAEEFSGYALRYMAATVAIGMLILSLAVIKFGRQPDIFPTQLRTTESKP